MNNKKSSLVLPCNTTVLRGSLPKSVNRFARNWFPSMRFSHSPFPIVLNSLNRGNCTHPILHSGAHSEGQWLEITPICLSWWLYIRKLSLCQPGLVHAIGRDKGMWVITVCMERLKQGRRVCEAIPSFNLGIGAKAWCHINIDFGNIALALVLVMLRILTKDFIGGVWVAAQKVLKLWTFFIGIPSTYCTIISPFYKQPHKFHC